MFWEPTKLAFTILECEFAGELSTVRGLMFEGVSFITLNSLDVNRFSFTLSMWLWIDSSYSSIRQTIATASGSYFSLEVEPATDTLYLN